MSQRIEKLKEGILTRKYRLCVEHARLVTESFKQTDGEPQVLRRAKAFANVLDNITIFIEDGELIVGNVASESQAVELSFLYGI